MQRRDDQIGVVVLQFGQAITELGPMVVVDQRERTGHVLRFGFPCPAGQRVADQLAHGLAARGEMFFVAKTVELFEQIVFQRYGKAYDLGHGAKAISSAKS